MPARRLLITRPSPPLRSALRVAAALLAATFCLPAGALGEQAAATADDPAAAGAAAADPTVELSAADEAFNRAAFERQKSKVAEWLADDAVFFSDVPNRGRDAFLAAWEPLWTGKYDFAYSATSLRAVVADSGELGFTLGEAETRFQHPADTEPTITGGHYLNVWQRSDKGAWRLRASSTLIVHAEWGAARDPRSGLMTAWPELAGSFDASIDIAWTPEQVLRAASGELAVTFGSYRASFEKDGTRHAGDGHFIAVWQLDESGNWQLAGEGLTPPGIYGEP